MDTTPISTLVIIAILAIIALFVFAGVWEARKTRQLVEQKIPVKMAIHNRQYSPGLTEEDYQKAEARRKFLQDLGNEDAVANSKDN